MKKGFKAVTAAALAISALTPVAAFAAENTVENGVYTTTNFYSLDAFKKLSGSAKAAALTSEGAVIVVAGKVYTGANVLSLNDTQLDASAVTVDAYNAANDNKLVSGKPIGGENQTGELKVASVNAINPTEIKVTFSAPVFADSVTEDDFKIYKNNSGTALTLTASTTTQKTVVVSEDGKSAIVQLDAPLVVGDTLKVVIDEGTILSKADYSKNVKATFNNISAPTDTAKAKLLKAEYSAAGKLTLTFDEPIDTAATGTAIKINQQAVTGLANSTVAGSYSYEVTPAAGSVKTGKNELELLNITDFAGNTTVLYSTEFTVNNANYEVPAVESVKADTATSFIIKTNKPVTAVTADVTLKLGNYTLVASDITSVTNVTATGAVAGGASEYVKVLLADTNTVNPLYPNNATSTTLAVNYKGFKDANDILGTEYNGSVTLTKDQVAPKVVSQNLISHTTGVGNKIVIPFDKNLSTTASDIVSAKISVKNGSVSATPASITVNGKNLELVLADNTIIAGDTYEIVLDAGAIKDTSGNTNVSTSLTYKVPAAVTYIDESTTVFATPVVKTTDNRIKITATYSAKVSEEAATATSYLLNGAALPAGTLVHFTDSNKDEVEIILPTSYKVSADNKAATIELKANTVKLTASGNVISSSTTEAKSIESAILLSDNVAPAVQKVELVKDSATGHAKGLKVTFTESIKDSTVLSTFVVKQDNTAITATAAAGAAGTADLVDDNILILDFTSTLAATTGITLELNSNATNVTLTDNATIGNKIEAFSPITAQ